MTDTIFDTTTATETVDTWLAAYGEPDRERRTELVRRVWAADGELIDPPLAGAGHDALVALADAVLEMFPGHTFRRTTDVDGHHRYARYGWELVASDGGVALGGQDLVELNANGQLQKVVGFFG